MAKDTSWRTRNNHWRSRWSGKNRRKRKEVMSNDRAGISNGRDWGIDSNIEGNRRLGRINR